MFSSPLFWELCILGAVLLFALPTIIAVRRRSADLPVVIWLNALALTVPFFGWMAAMGFACFSESRRPPRARTRPRNRVTAAPRQR